MWKAPQRAREARQSEISPDVGLEMSARYLYGAKKVLPEVAKDLKDRNPKIEAAPTRHPSAAGRLRWQVLTDVLNGGVSDLNTLVRKAGSNQQLQKDAQTFVTLEHDPHAVSTEQWTAIEGRHGWFARLAQAQSYPADSAEQRKLFRDGASTLIASGSFMLFLVVALMSGVVLLVLAILGWRSGRIKVVAARPKPTWGGVLLEGFAIYLLFMTLIPAGLRAWHKDFSPALFYFGILPVGLGLAMCWPLLRGVKVSSWRETLGLHMGRGFFREVGMGIVGWVTACPLIGLCIPLVYFIGKNSDMLFDHPIGKEFVAPGSSRIYAIVLATLWAPLTEETMFRGLLLPGLASSIRWLGGALVAAFIFAALHPQGLAAVPLLMMIALMVTALRLTRGSLVASMTAHAMNNGLIVALLYFAAG